MTDTVAIVAEGGGQRGIYTAGVLDAFIATGFNPFNLGVGVSAGAQNLLAFFLGRYGYARRAILELTSRPDFLRYRQCLRMRSMLDLDGYFRASISDPAYRLPYGEFASVAKLRRLQFVASDRLTLDAIYLEPDETNIVDCLKASSAVPFFYRRGVPMQEQTLVDGGVADPLPVRHAYAQGARTIVLVRTMPETAVGEPETHWQICRRMVSRWPLKSLLVARMLEQRRAAMQDAVDFMQSPPPDLQLHVIAPADALHSKWIGSTQEDLLCDYRLGSDHGRQAQQQLCASQVFRHPRSVRPANGVTSVTCV